MRYTSLNLLIMLVWACSSGCGLTGAEEDSVFSLKTADNNLAQALAHYSQGIIHEEVSGIGSASAIAEFEKAAQLDPERSAPYMRAAASAFVKSPEQAIEILREQCLANPSSLKAKIQLADTLYVIRRFTEAEKEYGEIIKISPENTIGYIGLAITHCATNNNNAAMEVIDKALRNCEDEDSRKQIFLLCDSRIASNLREGLFDMGLSWLTFTANRDTDRKARLLYAAGELYREQGNIKEATNFLKESIEQISPPMEAYSELILLLSASNNIAEAAEITEKAFNSLKDHEAILQFCDLLIMRTLQGGNIENDSAHLEALTQQDTAWKPQLHYTLAEIKRNMGNDEEARRHFNIAMESTPPIPEACIRLALMDINENPEKTKETLEKGLKKAPENTKIMFTLAYIYTYTFPDKASTAKDLFSQIMAINTKDGISINEDFYMHYARACELSDNKAAAEKVLFECLEHFPESHRAMNYIAYMWAEEGTNLNQALEYVTLALKSEPENGAYLDTLGWIYYRQERYEDALIQIEEALKDIKEDPVITDHLGDIHMALKNTEKAIACWKESFSIDPDNETVRQKLEKNGVDTESLKQSLSEEDPEDEEISE